MVENLARAGVALPPRAQLATDNSVDALVGWAREAREVGLGSVWLAQRWDHDALSVAAVIGALVPDLAIGTSVVPVYPRHPLVVHAQAQTAQAASHGRFHLGLGLGAPAMVAEGFGVDVGRPVAHLREYLTVLDRLKRDGAIDHDGATVTARSIRPVVVPGGGDYPVLVAAMGPQTLKVTGELADGILPFLAGPRALKEFVVPTLEEAAEAVGRPRPRVVALVPAVVTDDVAAVTAVARAEMGFYANIPSYRAVLDREGVEHPAELAVIGSEDRLAEAVAAYRAAGADEVVLSQTGLASDDDRRRTWAALAKLG